jgi:uncharacterized membrane protein YvbJ
VGNMTRCPDCGSAISQAAGACPKCGRTFGSEGPPKRVELGETAQRIATGLMTASVGTMVVVLLLFIALTMFCCKDLGRGNDPEWQRKQLDGK